MDLRSWLSALGGAPAGGAAYGMAAPPVQNAQPMGLAVPPMARGTKLSAEMDYDGSHPRQQEQVARDHFRSYGPQMLADAFIPGYGAGGDAKAASEAYGEGRYGAAAGNALMAAMDFLPVLGALPAAAKGIRAFHGSPHDFDRFDMSKIGTGEGAQAYGHGLYFAENEAVARGYRDDLSLDGLVRLKGPEGAIKYLEDTKLGAGEAQKAAADRYIQAIRSGQSTGRMYEVNINADPEAFLDWDKPLSEQGAAVREGVIKAYGSAQPVRLSNGRYGMVRTRPDGSGDKIYGVESDTAEGAREALKEYLMAGRGDDIAISMAHSRGQSPAAATAALRDAGIPGIKYLDAGSRGAGDGSRNYVVFDDRLITILRKYGIGGLIAGGGAYALTDAEYAQAAELLAQDNTGAQ